ncbi:MAG: DUF6754 domain-containing protein, partial [Nitrospirales bacterium]
MFLTVGLWGCFLPGQAESSLNPPDDVRVVDTPSDSGGALTVIWPPAAYDGPDVRYQILIAETSEITELGQMTVVAEFPSQSHYVRETRWPWWTRPADPTFHAFTIRSGETSELKPGVSYRVAVAAVKAGERALSPTGEAIA